jgi:hypothetical protein
VATNLNKQKDVQSEKIIIDYKNVSRTLPVTIGITEEKK